MDQLLQVVVANMLETRRSEVILVSQGPSKELITRKLKVKEKLSEKENFIELEEMIVDELCRLHRTFSSS